MKYPHIDLAKVEAAVRAIEARKRANMPNVDAAVARMKPMLQVPLPPSPVAQDAAIRGKLRAHGIKCCGFNHYHLRQFD